MHEALGRRVCIHPVGRQTRTQRHLERRLQTFAGIDSCFKQFEVYRQAHTGVAAAVLTLGAFALRQRHDILAGECFNVADRSCFVDVCVYVMQCKVMVLYGIV